MQLNCVTLTAMREELCINVFETIFVNDSLRTFLQFSITPRNTYNIQMSLDLAFNQTANAMHTTE